MTDRILVSGEEVLPVRHCVASNVATGNGIIRVTCFRAARGEKITQVKMVSGGTATDTPTLARVGIYLITGSAGVYTGTLVASTDSDTTLFAATSTAYTRSFTAPWWKTEGLLYGLAVLVAGAVTAGTLTGLQLQSSVSLDTLTDPPSGLVLTGQTDLPSTATFNTTTGGTNQPYGVLLP